MSKLINKVQIKKATRVEKLLCYIIKLDKPVMQSPFMGLINLSIQISSLPGSVKHAERTHLHKKNDPMKNSILDLSAF